MLKFKTHIAIPPHHHDILLHYSNYLLAYQITGHFPPPLVCLMLLFITKCCTNFSTFVLCFSLLIHFLSHLVSALYSTIGSWCIPALYTVFLPCISARLWLSPFHYFALDYQFSNQILHILSFSFLPLCSGILLCLALTRSVSLQAALTNILLSIKNTGTTLLADTALLKPFTTQNLPYINPVIVLHVFFWIPKP